MFDDIVSNYDLLNDVLSLGFDRRWRRQAAEAVAAPEGSAVLDLGCGTGRMGERLARRHVVVGIDLSAEMLAAARRRMGDRMVLVQASALRLPFADGAFAAAVSAFVLRNLPDLPAAFGEASRVLRPDGRVAFVDITEPASPVLRRAFDAYFRAAAPALGALVGKHQAYRYLVRSLAQLPAASTVCTMLEQSGFEDVRARVLPPGMVTLWTAKRARGDSGG
jgi:demethylmenaquinone methyltransferase/2-methoxy-6-polyprenyl-1,4-benzoquinol methylase